MSHVFDETIAVRALAEHRFAARTNPAYANMVGPFGGAIAATVLAAMQSHPEALGSPLALTINYLAPLAEGDWEIAAQPLRTNRTNQHWSFTAGANGAAALSGTAVFGLPRATWSDTEAEPPAVQEPAAYPASAFPDFIAWAGNYEMRFAVGAVRLEDRQPAEDSTSTLWVRDRPPRPLDFPALTALADTFFPRVFLRRGVFMPIGTISLTVYYHAGAEELAAQGDGPVLATARSGRFHQGHYDQSGRLFASDGSLLATTHQLVYFKDPE